jgi:hypothetical protein
MAQSKARRARPADEGNAKLGHELHEPSRAGGAISHGAEPARWQAPLMAAALIA